MRRADQMARKLISVGILLGLFCALGANCVLACAPGQSRHDCCPKSARPDPCDKPSTPENCRLNLAEAKVSALPDATGVHLEPGVLPVSFVAPLTAWVEEAPPYLAPDPAGGALYLSARSLRI